MGSESYPKPDISAPAPDRAARTAGGLLLVTAVVTAVMVYARVAAGADQEGIPETLRAISESRVMYGTSGAARALSGVAFFASAWFLLRTWIIRDGWATPLVPYLFALSGLFTVISGACAIYLTVYSGPDISYGAEDTSQLVEGIYGLRWIAGKAGFTAAGAALIVAARYQWQVGGALKRISPFSALIGVAMQFIWLDAATIVHPFIGTAFFLWLLLVGTMLATGRVERHFVTRYSLEPS